MITAPLPAQETHRLAVLSGLKLLDTPPEERFDRITRLARRLFGVSYAVVSLVDARRQWFKSAPGLPFRETPRDVSFCGHAILGDGLMVVPDAAADPRFRDNPMVVGGPRIRFYAGMPLTGPGGAKLGTLCLLDGAPRSFGEEDGGTLKDLAKMVEEEMNAVELNEAVARLRESESKIKQLKDDAVSLASHELRTPLAVVLTALQAIELDGKNGQSEKTGEFLAMARRNAERLLELVNRYLDLAKIESGALELKTRPVELGPLIERVVWDMELAAAKRGVRFALEGGLPDITVATDPDRLVQVLNNLLSNAAKFSPVGGVVGVSWTLQDGEAGVAVSDQGPGISPEFRSRIFGKFAQDRATEASRETRGTGLGLSIAKAIVERMGGRIGFETEPGLGTTFRFSLPVWKNSAIAALAH